MKFRSLALSLRVFNVRARFSRPATPSDVSCFILSVKKYMETITKNTLAWTVSVTEGATGTGSGRCDVKGSYHNTRDLGLCGRPETSPFVTFSHVFSSLSLWLAKYSLHIQICYFFEVAVFFPLWEEEIRILPTVVIVLSFLFILKQMYMSNFSRKSMILPENFSRHECKER